VNDSISLYNAGTRALHAGQLRPALTLLQQAIDSSSVAKIQGSAFRNMGVALRKLGAPQEAAQAFSEALRIDKNDLDARYSLGNALVALGDYQGAIKAFQIVRNLRPEWAQPANNEGAAWMALGRTTEAEACFQDAVRIDPSFAHAWGNLGAARAAQGQHAAPLHSMQKALALAPNDQHIRTKLGHLLTELGHFDAAVRTFNTVLNGTPNHSDARAGLSLALHRSGDTIGALAQVAPAIAAGNPHPDEAVAFARISMYMNRPEDAVDTLRSALSRAGQPATKVLLGKHLGQLLDAAGHTDEAFAAIEQANSLRNLTFDAQEHSGHIDAIIHRTQQPHSTSSCNDETPVFIVGMPRSGTSLIEQMLDAHPEIYGAGERGDLQMIAGVMDGRELDETMLQELSGAYLNRIRPLAPQAKLITDKMPNNFLYLNEAGRLFPRARVIHCVRDPADTGLSCLFQNFKDTLPWATRQEDIAAFTEDYHRLMDHWAEHSSLRMLTVPYEALVQNPEKWAARLLRFLDVPFHSAVVHPDRNPRIVRTASHDQIRRPIHTGSIGRFRAYEAHIQTLLNLRPRFSQTDGLRDRRDDGRTHHA
jgi:tetratricopeptide (TPR) repeat protein